MRHHAPSPAYLNIFEFRLFQGNASWRHHNLRLLSILTEAYCLLSSSLIQRGHVFSVFSLCRWAREEKTSFSHHAMHCTTLGIFKCKESPVGATGSNIKLGSRTSEPKHMCRTKCDMSEIQLLPSICSSIFKQTCWNHTYYVLESLRPLPAFSVSIRNKCFGL